MMMTDHHALSQRLCAVGTALQAARDTTLDDPRPGQACRQGALWLQLDAVLRALDAVIDLPSDAVQGPALQDADVPPLALALDGGAPCPHCGEAGCAGTCVEAHLDASARTYPHVQAQAARLYATYVAGLGPLGTDLPPWHGLIDRQQFAWRCVARAQEDTP